MYNIQMDPHEDVNVAGYDILFGSFAIAEVEKFAKSAKQYPIPAAPNMSNFKFGPTD